MKKLGITITLLFLFSITLATAVPTLNIQHEDIQPGETLLATISLDSGEEFIEQITLDNIEFLEGRKSVFIEHDIIFYENTHYLYAYLIREGNFTLKINNILYKSGEETKEATFEKIINVRENLIITEEEKINQTTNETYYEEKTSTKIISIKPGFFFGTENPEITLENKGDSNLNISYDESEITLTPNQKQKISPIIKNQTPFFLELVTYKTFSIPIIYILTPIEIENKTLIILKSNPSLLHVNLIANQEKPETIEIFNFLEQNITEVSITSNLSIMEITNLEDLETIKANEAKNLSLIFNSEKTGYTEGEISITYTANEEQYELIISVFVYILPENSTQEDLETIEDYSLLQNECESSGGKVCTVEETCDGQETYNGIFCCLATCVTLDSDEDDDSDGGGWGWLIGLLIIVVLGVIGFFAYKKFKKTKPPAPEQKLATTTKTYESRISGGLSRG